MIRAALAGMFDDGSTDPKARLVGICGVLGVLNLGAWVWSLSVFHDKPALLGMTLLAYGLGLRHAFDAGPSAAIDNVTRKLAGEDRRPVSVSFFFAVDHSAVVVLVVAGAATMLGSFRSLGETGETISTVISAAFLFPWRR